MPLVANTLALPPSTTESHSWLKATGLALVLVLALGALAGAWAWSHRQPRAHASIETNLLATIESAQISPHLALRVLADYPAEQVWQEPMAQEQWEGALAAWLFGPAQPDHASIEMLLRLAQAQASSAPDDAATYLLAAADVARISPELTDRERADFLVLIGERMAQIGLRSAAMAEWHQARMLAQHSPTLQPMVRATFFQTLANSYRWIDAEVLAEEARKAATQVGTASVPVAEPERTLPDTAAPPDEPADLRTARERRRIAALQTALALNGGTGEGAYEELREALTAEGALHRAWIAEQLNAELPLPQKAGLLQYHIQWLQRERMLAAGAGGEEFSAWTTRREEIGAELHEAWNALEQVRLEQGIAGAAREQATLAHRDWWAARLVQARLGRDPGLHQEEILASMRPNQADEAGGAELRLDWVQGRFWRLPREWVGHAELPE